jgi:hypothetical protein
MNDDVGTSGPDAATSPLRSNGTRASAEPVISPELALVDPELAARGQAALPETRDTVELLLQSARARGAGTAGGDRPGRVRRTRKRLLRGALLAAGLAGVVVVVLGFDFGIEFGERSAPAEQAIGPVPAAPGEAVATPPRAQRKQKPARPAPPGSSKPQTHRSSVRARAGAGKDGSARKRVVSAPSLAASSGRPCPARPDTTSSSSVGRLACLQPRHAAPRSLFRDAGGSAGAPRASSRANTAGTSGPYFVRPDVRRPRASRLVSAWASGTRSPAVEECFSPIRGVNGEHERARR